MKSHIASGELRLLGVTQEQHPERCRLFAQWKQFDWPILHDPINLLGSRGVPLTVAIDEHGIVRSLRPSPTWVRETFLNTDYPAPSHSGDTDSASPPPALQAAKESTSRQGWLEQGDAQMLWGAPTETSAAVHAYQAAVRANPRDGVAHFRLGVAHRRRYETPSRQVGDFQSAIDQWSKALEIDPNQYIWRRRLQQFGPRLIKPYPFYDWVEQARVEITRRGERPTKLPVPPSGAEIAQPSVEFEKSAEVDQSPDPDRRIDRDLAKLITISHTVVPARLQPGEAARIHLDLRPAVGAKWNNEADPLVVWIDPKKGWERERGLLRFAGAPREAESREPRRIEVEVKASPACPPGKHVLSGYALYYVCRSDDGTCLYLRQETEVALLVAER